MSKEADGEKVEVDSDGVFCGRCGKLIQGDGPYLTMLNERGKLDKSKGRKTYICRKCLYEVRRDR